MSGEISEYRMSVMKTETRQTIYGYSVPEETEQTDHTITKSIVIK